MERKNLLAHLDEETLTAGFFGGLASATALFVECYGSGIEGRTRECSWGMFKKSRPKAAAAQIAGRLEQVGHEPESGADFALVLWQTHEDALVAIFQAKKPEVGSEGLLSVHRAANATTGHAQLVVFAAMCWMMRDRTTPTPLYPSIHDALYAFRQLSSEDRKELVNGLVGGHYLIYDDLEPICVPLSAIDSETIEREMENKPSRPIPRDRWSGKQTFASLLRNGVNGVAAGWLPMKRTQIEGLLPHLIGLMDIYEATERGGKGLALDGVPKQTGGTKARASTATQVRKLQRILSGETSPAPGSQSGRGRQPGRP